MGGGGVRVCSWCPPPVVSVCDKWCRSQLQPLCVGHGGMERGVSQAWSHTAKPCDPPLISLGWGWGGVTPFVAPQAPTLPQPHRGPGIKTHIPVGVLSKHPPPITL